MTSASHGVEGDQSSPRIGRRPSRRVTLALALALVPGLVFTAGVVTVARWGVPLWPHQLFFEMLIAAVAGPLVAAIIVRRRGWALTFAALFVVASLLALDGQMELVHHEWDSCPISRNPAVGEMTMTGFGITRPRAMCVYSAPHTGREIDRTSFTVFDRIQYLTGTRRAN